MAASVTGSAASVASLLAKLSGNNDVPMPHGAHDNGASSYGVVSVLKEGPMPMSYEWTHKRAFATQPASALGLILENDCRVVAVAPRSPAADAHVRPGLIVSQVNGQSVASPQVFGAHVQRHITVTLLFFDGAPVDELVLRVTEAPYGDDGTAQEPSFNAIHEENPQRYGFLSFQHPLHVHWQDRAAKARSARDALRKYELEGIAEREQAEAARRAELDAGLAELDGLLSSSDDEEDEGRSNNNNNALPPNVAPMPKAADRGTAASTPAPAAVPPKPMASVFEEDDDVPTGAPDNTTAAQSAGHTDTPDGTAKPSPQHVAVAAPGVVAPLMGIHIPVPAGPVQVEPIDPANPDKPRRRFGPKPAPPRGTAPPIPIALADFPPAPPAPKVTAAAQRPPEDAEHRHRETCRNFAVGRCTRGTGCVFLHPPQVRPRRVEQPCGDFLRGRCDRGAQCRYLHEDDRHRGHRREGSIDRRRYNDDRRGSRYSPPRDAPRRSSRYDEPRGPLPPPPGPARGDICGDFQRGRCFRGEGCRYMHVDERHARRDPTPDRFRRGPTPDHYRRDRTPDRYRRGDSPRRRSRRSDSPRDRRGRR